jgi:hypothetical protein
MEKIKLLTGDVVLGEAIDGCLVADCTNHKLFVTQSGDLIFAQQQVDRQFVEVNTGTWNV